MQDLLESYQGSLAVVRYLQRRARDRNTERALYDLSLLQEMEADLLEVTGTLTRRHPAARPATRPREIPVDPVVMARLRHGAASPVSRKRLRLVQAEADKVLAILTEREQEVCRLVWGAKYSLQETAQALGLSKSSVQATLDRARQKVSVGR